MISIFNYTDYRLFLKDFYQSKKEKNSNFSYRYIADKVGFKSAGHFTQILKGQANISNHLINRFGKFMKLKKREIEYFELLVHFNQSKTQEEKRHYYERIVNFKEATAKIVSPEQYEFYQKWYYAVIRDILSLYEFKGDFKALASLVQPSIATQEAERAIKLLVKLDLIHEQDDGRYRVTDLILSSQPDGYSLALSGYAKQMINQASNAVDMLPKDERIISWAGFSVSDKTFEMIKDEIRASRRKIMSLVENDTHPERVYHFNSQLFPVSKKISFCNKR